MGSGNTTTLIISNDEVNDIIKIVKCLEDSGLLLKGVTERVQKERKRRFLSILLGTSGASSLGIILTGRAINRAGKNCEINIAGEWILRAGYGNPSTKIDF